MTPFPPIQRPCPYLDRLDAVIDAGFCRMCRREVHDLTAMDGRERADFLRACGGDACISYTMNVKPALAAALIAASAAVLAAPGIASAKDPQVGRSLQRERPVYVRTVPVLVAGGITAPPVAQSGDPVPPKPVEPRSPPQNPE
jgi:hypothetical protein